MCLPCFKHWPCCSFHTTHPEYSYSSRANFPTSNRGQMIQGEVEGTLTQRTSNEKAKIPCALLKFIIISCKKKDKKILKIKEKILNTDYPNTTSSNLASGFLSSGRQSVWITHCRQQKALTKGQAPPSLKHSLLGYTLAEWQEVLQRIAEMLDSERTIRISLPKNATNAKLRQQVMPVIQARPQNQTHDITETRQLISAAVEDKSHCSGTLSIPAHHQHQPKPSRRPQAQHQKKSTGCYDQSRDQSEASQKNQHD